VALRRWGTVETKGLLGFLHQGHFLVRTHLGRPKKLLTPAPARSAGGSAISNSFFPNSCFSFAIRRSYSVIMLSRGKTSAHFFRKAFLQALAVFGWMPYALAACAAVFSPLNNSSTIWNLISPCIVFPRLHPLNFVILHLSEEV